MSVPTRRGSFLYSRVHELPPLKPYLICKNGPNQWAIRFPATEEVYTISMGRGRCTCGHSSRGKFCTHYKTIITALRARERGQRRPVHRDRF